MPNDARVEINLPIEPWEVPALREAVGWPRADADFPRLFEQVVFWGGSRDAEGTLIAFAYLAAPARSHGFLEDVIVHPACQRQGLGTALVRRMLQEAHRAGVGVVTITYRPEHRGFYERCGFRWCDGGVWPPDGESVPPTVPAQDSLAQHSPVREVQSDTRERGGDHGAAEAAGSPG